MRWLWTELSATTRRPDHHELPSNLAGPPLPLPVIRFRSVLRLLSWRIAPIVRPYPRNRERSRPILASLRRSTNPARWSAVLRPCSDRTARAQTALAWRTPSKTPAYSTPKQRIRERLAALALPILGGNFPSAAEGAGEAASRSRAARH